MDNFEKALGWYRISTKRDCEVKIENKKLNLLNFNTCGASTFEDENNKLYMIRTCEISAMSPCKAPKSKEDEEFDRKCEFGIGIGIFMWCKENNMPFLVDALRSARREALSLLNGELHNDSDYNKKTLQCYNKMLQLNQFRGKRFAQGDIV